MCLLCGFAQGNNLSSGIVVRVSIVGLQVRAPRSLSHNLQHIGKYEGDTYNILGRYKSPVGRLRVIVYLVF